MKTALSIAGSDPSGGAGIQADLKTMTMHGVYAMSAVTALTAQNTTGVRGVLECSPEFLALQLDCVFSDIVPDAVKTGMVASAPLIRVIADRLTHYQVQNLVVDPVMVSTSGSRLLEEEALEALHKRKKRQLRGTREFLEEMQAPPEARGLCGPQATAGKLDLTIGHTARPKVVSLPVDKEFRGAMTPKKQKAGGSGGAFLDAKAGAALKRLKAMNE